MLKPIILSTILGIPLTLLCVASLPTVDSSKIASNMYTSKEHVDAINVNGDLDYGEETRRTLQGLSRLISELQEGKSGPAKIEALKLNIAVMTSYLAVLMSHMSPEDRQEIMHISKELYESVTNKETLNKTRI